MFDVADSAQQSGWRRQFYQEQFVLLHKMAVRMVARVEEIKTSPERAKKVRPGPTTPRKEVFRGKGAKALTKLFKGE